MNIYYTPADKRLFIIYGRPESDKVTSVINDLKNGSNIMKSLHRDFADKEVYSFLVDSDSLKNPGKRVFSMYVEKLPEDLEKVEEIGRAHV